MKSCGALSVWEKCQRDGRRGRDREEHFEHSSYHSVYLCRESRVARTSVCHPSINYANTVKSENMNACSSFVCPYEVGSKKKKKQMEETSYTARISPFPVFG